MCKESLSGCRKTEGGGRKHTWQFTGAGSCSEAALGRLKLSAEISRAAMRRSASVAGSPCELPLPPDDVDPPIDKDRLWAGPGRPGEDPGRDPPPGWLGPAPPAVEALPRAERPLNQPTKRPTPPPGLRSFRSFFSSFSCRTQSE